MGPQLWLEAEVRYAEGDDAEDSEPGRAAYRKVCVEHEAVRDVALDEMHGHAREHLALWHAWFGQNCLGTLAAVDRESGEATAATVCEPEAGTPPPRFYVRTSVNGTAGYGATARTERRCAEG